ncbi:MAG: hypothetical protein SFY32_16200 [Bacteroidota bacterium]|nr:hypothetical protein [Bacteroidota bacterium]
MFLFFFEIDAQRARDPWVFRSVMDGTPRAITFALNYNLWAAYNTENCRLFKLWNGGVSFRGEVYTGEKVLQPVAVGDTYYDNKDTTLPFYTLQNGDWIMAKRCKFLKYTILNNKSTMYYLITDINGNEYEISESPEYTSNQLNEIGFSRTWYVNGPNKNVTIGAKISLIQMNAFKSYFATSEVFLLQKTESYIKGNTIYSAEAIMPLVFDRKNELINYFKK